MGSKAKKRRTLKDKQKAQNRAATTANKTPSATGEPVKRVSSEPPKRYVCPFPNCGKVFFQEAGKPDVCNFHRQFIEDFAFCMKHVTIKDKVEQPSAAEALAMSRAGKGGVILIPKPGMSAKAIEEALAKQAKGGA